MLFGGDFREWRCFKTVSGCQSFFGNDSMKVSQKIEMCMIIHGMARIWIHIDYILTLLTHTFTYWFMTISIIACTLLPFEACGSCTIRSWALAINYTLCVIFVFILCLMLSYERVDPQRGWCLLKGFCLWNVRKSQELVELTANVHEEYGE